jgi:predicted dehydrogenase
VNYLGSKLGVVVVGAGKIGTTRATIAADSEETEMTQVVDLDLGKAKRISESLGCAYGSDLHAALASSHADIVIVSTTNNSLAKVTGLALAAGKHVLVEKPGATCTKDFLRLVRLAEKKDTICKVGYNHRFHPAVSETAQMVKSKSLGRLTFLRIRHGHGGRRGYEKEWRSNPLLAGGGELMDQGVHGLDLINWFLTPIHKVVASTESFFWQSNVEDNAILLLLGPNHVCASLFASWTQWKPIFSLEVYGTSGFAEVNGLGGVYGQETLICGSKKNAEMSRTVFSQVDHSWRLEWNHFVECVEKNRVPLSGFAESLNVLRIVDAAYSSSNNDSAVVSLSQE